MPRFSNAMFIALNLISLAMGFAAVFCSAYVQMHDGSACQKTLEMPLLVTGLFLLIVSTLGLVAAVYLFVCDAHFDIRAHSFHGFCAHRYQHVCG